LLASRPSSRHYLWVVFGRVDRKVHPTRVHGAAKGLILHGSGDARNDLFHLGVCVDKPFTRFHRVERGGAALGHNVHLKPPTRLLPGSRVSTSDGACGRARVRGIFGNNPSSKLGCSSPHPQSAPPSPAHCNTTHQRNTRPRPEGAKLPWGRVEMTLRPSQRREKEKRNSRQGGVSQQCSDLGEPCESQSP
jgi:hypothetical protein